MIHVRSVSTCGGLIWFEPKIFSFIKEEFFEEWAYSICSGEHNTKVFTNTANTMCRHKCINTTCSQQRTLGWDPQVIHGYDAVRTGQVTQTDIQINKPRIERIDIHYEYNTVSCTGQSCSSADPNFNCQHYCLGEERPLAPCPTIACTVASAYVSSAGTCLGDDGACIGVDMGVAYIFLRFYAWMCVCMHVCYSICDSDLVKNIVCMSEMCAYVWLYPFACMCLWLFLCVYDHCNGDLSIRWEALDIHSKYSCVFILTYITYDMLKNSPGATLPQNASLWLHPDTHTTHTHAYTCWQSWDHAAKRLWGPLLSLPEPFLRQCAQPAGMLSAITWMCWIYSSTALFISAYVRL